MKITRKQLAHMAKNLLDIIKDEKIETTEEFGRIMGKVVNVKKTADRVIFENRPSNGETNAYTVAYVLEKVGMPIELRINANLGYSIANIKCSDCIAGYSPFRFDDYGNFFQNKVIRDKEFYSCVRELERLTR